MNVGCIPGDEIQFHPHSFADPDGRLFVWKNELYRAVTAAGAPVVRRLFADNLVSTLTRRGLLVATTMTPLQLDGFELVLHHQQVPFVSYPNEWCPAMLKAALLVELDLVIELSRHGLTIKDANPWNILVDGTTPVHVDFTSIAPLHDSNGWPTYDRFCRRCLYPLQLMAGGYELIARLLLSEDEGVIEDLLLKLTEPAAPVRRLVRRVMRSLSRRAGKVAGFGPANASASSLVDSLTAVRNRVERISLPNSAAQESRLLSTSSEEQINGQVIGKLFTQLKPQSVLDVGSIEGAYANLAARDGANAVFMDARSESVTPVYLNARAHAANILALVIDVTNPTPSRGMAHHASIAAAERLRCDMVVVSDFERLVAKTRLDASRIVGGLAIFAKRWLLVEVSASNHPSQLIDELAAALRREFSRVDRLESAQDQKWFLCERGESF